MNIVRKYGLFLAAVAVGLVSFGAGPAQAGATQRTYSGCTVQGISRTTSTGIFVWAQAITLKKSGSCGRISARIQWTEAGTVHTSARDYSTGNQAEAHSGQNTRSKTGLIGFHSVEAGGAENNFIS
ncbi:hypothetical protein ACFLIM_49845 [Nonomuraea sp. M3C6]|uniref:DUF2690 domain-containing protein n=1 Tax=Nonomuraea marmarensis TaxID=3351344 RepID=A0ABW7AV33_9ACTN